MTFVANTLETEKGLKTTTFVHKWSIDLDENEKNSLFDQATGDSAHEVIQSKPVDKLEYFDPPGEEHPLAFNYFLVPRNDWVLDLYAKVIYDSAPAQADKLPMYQTLSCKLGVMRGRGGPIIVDSFGKSPSQHLTDIVKKLEYHGKRSTSPWVANDLTVESRPHDWFKTTFTKDSSPSTFHNLTFITVVRKIFNRPVFNPPSPTMEQCQSQSFATGAQRKRKCQEPTASSSSSQAGRNTASAAAGREATFQIPDFLFSPKFSDVTITCGNKKFHAHQILIFSKSTLLRTVVEQDKSRPNSTRNITIVDFEPEIVEELLRFIYTGAVDDLAKNAKELFLISGEYDVAELKNISEDSLLTTLSVENVLERYEVGKLLDSRQIIDKCIDIIKGNKSKIWKNEADFGEACKKYPELIFKLFLI